MSSGDWRGVAEVRDVAVQARGVEWSTGLRARVVVDDGTGTRRPILQRLSWITLARLVPGRRVPLRVGAAGVPLVDERALQDPDGRLIGVAQQRKDAPSIFAGHGKLARRGTRAEVTVRAIAQGSDGFSMASSTVGPARTGAPVHLMATLPDGRELYGRARASCAGVPLPGDRLAITYLPDEPDRWLWDWPPLGADAAPATSWIGALLGFGVVTEPGVGEQRTAQVMAVVRPRVEHRPRHPLLLDLYPSDSSAADDLRARGQARPARIVAWRYTLPGEDNGHDYVVVVDVRSGGPPDLRRIEVPATHYLPGPGSDIGVRVDPGDPRRWALGWPPDVVVDPADWPPPGTPGVYVIPVDPSPAADPICSPDLHHLLTAPRPGRRR